MREYMQAQHEWSMATFGPGLQTERLVAHIRKELDEVLAEPLCLMEWVDVIILALDGALRLGYSPDVIIGELKAKLRINMARKWDASTGEHIDE